MKNTKNAMVMSPNILDKILKDKVNFEIFKKSFISVGGGPQGTLKIRMLLKGLILAEKPIKSLDLTKDLVL